MHEYEIATAKDPTRTVASTTAGDAQPPNQYEDTAHAAGDPDRTPKKGMDPRRALLVRRLIALAIILAMAYGMYHVLFQADVLAPLWAYAEPIKDGIAWVRADPMRAWGALAVIVIPYIGTYYMLFDDRK